MRFETRNGGGVRVAWLAAGLVLLAGSGSAADWRIIAVSGAPVSGEPVIAFTNEGGITGTTGCNRFTASGRATDGAIEIAGPVAMTRMACPGAALTAQDDALAAFLTGRIGIAFDPFSGRMMLSKGDTDLTLVMAEAAPGDTRAAGFQPQRDVPAGSPPYLGVLGLADALPIRAAPDLAAAEVGGVLSGTVLRNEGCNGAGWCAVATLSGETSGWAQDAYLEPANPALRAGQEVFDATGIMPCAKGDGAPTTACAFGVARGAGGAAAVVVRRPDGLQRVLYFEDGRFAFSDTSEADGGFESSAEREGDLNLIRVDDERYEVPDAVVLGG